MKNQIRPISHQAYERTKNRILLLESEFGERINIKALSGEFHISPTPIREGTKKLIEDRLIEDIPRKDDCVYPPTPKDIQDIHELRRMLESFTLIFVRTSLLYFRPLEELKRRIEYIQNKRIKKRRFIGTESVDSPIVCNLNNQRIGSIYENLHNFTLLF